MRTSSYTSDISIVLIAIFSIIIVLCIRDMINKHNSMSYYTAADANTLAAQNARLENDRFYNIQTNAPFRGWLAGQFGSCSKLGKPDTQDDPYATRTRQVRCIYNGYMSEAPDFILRYSYCGNKNMPAGSEFCNKNQYNP